MKSYAPLLALLMLSGCATAYLSNYEYINQTRPLPDNVKSGPIGQAFACQSISSASVGSAQFNFTDGGIIPSQVLDLAILDARLKLGKGQKGLNGLINATSYVMKDANTNRSCLWVSGHLALTPDSTDFFEDADALKKLGCGFESGIRFGQTSEGGPDYVIKGFDPHYTLVSGHLKQGDKIIGFGKDNVVPGKEVDFNSSQTITVRYYSWGEPPEKTAEISPRRKVGCP